MILKENWIINSIQINDYNKCYNTFGSYNKIEMELKLKEIELRKKKKEDELILIYLVH